MVGECAAFRASAGSWNRLGNLRKNGLLIHRCCEPLDQVQLIKATVVGGVRPMFTTVSKPKKGIPLDQGYGSRGGTLNFHYRVKAKRGYTSD